MDKYHRSVLVSSSGKYTDYLLGSSGAVLGSSAGQPCGCWISAGAWWGATSPPRSATLPSAQHTHFTFFIINRTKKG